jgi:hypothetical protein
MTGKEALESMCRRCEKYVGSIPSKGDRPFKACPWRDISGDHCGEYDAVRKGLDMLEALQGSLLLMKAFDSDTVSYGREYVMTYDSKIVEWVRKGEKE